MSSQIFKKLQKLGLSEQATKTYMACANQGTLTPSQISEVTGIKRTSVYVYLKELRKKGLVTEKKSGRKRLVTAEPPQVIKTLIKEEQKRLEEQLIEVDVLIEELQKIHKQEPRQTKTTTIEGQAGLKNLADLIIHEKEDLYWIGSLENFLEKVDEETLFRFLTWRRMNQKTTAYAITDTGILKHKKFSEPIKNFREMKFTNKQIQSHSLLVIFGNKTAVVSFETQPIKIITVEDNATTNLMRTMFNLIWNNFPDVT